MSIHPTRDDRRRIRLLRNNLIDLDMAISDVDAEIATRLDARARLGALLRDAETELAALIGRAA